MYGPCAVFYDTGSMIIETPIGPLTAVLDKEGSLTQLSFRPVPEAAGPSDTRVAEQLAEYFAGKRRTFDLPLALRGTEFQVAVWNELLCVGYGETITYAQLAIRIGRPAAVRAVGAANGANPIPVIVPCHRVIGTNGTLTGYGGGIERKQWLLAHEGRRLF